MTSIRRGLTLSMLAAFGFLMCVGGFLIYWAMRNTLYQQFDASLYIRAQIVMNHVQQQDRIIQVYFSDQFLREFGHTVENEFFQVFTTEGVSVARSNSLGVHSLPFKNSDSAQSLFENFILPGEKPGRLITVDFTPAIEHPRRHRSQVNAIAVVASDRSELEKTLARLRLILLSSGSLLLALTVIAVWFVLRYGLRPLDRVAQAATRIEATSLQQRFTVQSLPAELQPIASGLNDLLARLEDSFERERRFTSDIAHELRTPLAELRSMMEVALKWPEERSTESDRIVLDIAQQMEALVSRLLSLAHAEQGGLTPTMERVSISQIIDDVTTTLQSAALARKQTFSRHFSADDFLTTDRVLFTSIVTNLLENAVNYSPEESAIEISFSQSSDTFQLSITNPVENLDTTDLSKMFNRLWRKENARSGNGHSGLGLALSRTFATLLGYQLNASLSERELFITMMLTGKR